MTPTEIARKLTKAQREAVQRNSPSGFMTFFATIACLWSVQFFFGPAAAIWAGVGALVTALVAFYEIGRVDKIKRKALDDAVRAELMKEEG